jgi:hypothetical protein
LISVGIGEVPAITMPAARVSIEISVSFGWFPLRCSQTHNLPGFTPRGGSSPLSGIFLTTT